MAQTFDNGKDLSKEMHVLRAIRWGISAWENDVTSETIQNCWSRSQVIDFGSRPIPSPDLWAESQPQLDSIYQTLQRLRESGYINDIPNIREYISPYAERVESQTAPDYLVDEIIAQYTQENKEEDDKVEVKAGEPLPRVTTQEALIALNTLCQYEEQNKGNLELLRLLRRHENELIASEFKSRHQTQLNNWLIRR